jgi:hypothetical protein
MQKEGSYIGEVMLLLWQSPRGVDLPGCVSEIVARKIAAKTLEHGSCLNQGDCYFKVLSRIMLGSICMGRSVVLGNNEDRPQREKF